MLAVYRKLYFLLTKSEQLSPNEQYLKVSVKSKRDLSVTGSKPPPLIRRSSFPAQFPEVRSRQAPQRQQSHPGVPPSRRMSVDLAEDDSSPDRRRVRIIRRHWVRRTSRLSTRRAWYRQDSGESTSYQEVLRLGFCLSTYQTIHRNNTTTFKTWRMTQKVLKILYIKRLVDIDIGYINQSFNVESFHNFIIIKLFTQVIFRWMTCKEIYKILEYKDQLLTLSHWLHFIHTRLNFHIP